ncbi:FAD-dependent oxidoreductase [Streptomyces sp. NPDC051211]|uniref:FAD-dependent oxidoreductase n=1 Tax=Streptomyces sp. NPDC051211 TaxID=3154643 RepID=UPI00344B91D8
MPRHDPVQVLVVGAGPAGLTAAHELARRGVRVRLVDAAAGPDPGSRAVSVHPRTLELFDQMGVVGPLLEHGREIRSFTVHAAGHRLLRLDAGHATAAAPALFPYPLVIGQAHTEALLRAAVRRLGVRIEWGVRLTGLAQDEDEDEAGVRAHLTHPDGRAETLTVPWLIGCDGRHSTVRKRLQLPLTGESAETWELADAPVEYVGDSDSDGGDGRGGGDSDGDSSDGAGARGLPRDTVSWVYSGSRVLVLVPYAREGHWRLLSPAPAPGADADPRPVAERFAAHLSAGLGRAVRVGTPEWTAVFAFRQRMVSRMREGRCFLAGDAAHVHSPLSGQGMNTGIQEAFNLAWKLAAVVAGRADPALLDTYEEERLPLGRAMLDATGSKGVSLLRLALPVDLPLGACRNPPDGSYPDSSLSTGAHAAGLPAGSRAATAAARHPGDPGTAALRAELREVRWSLLYVPEGTGEALATAADAARRHAAWLSVRTVGAALPPTCPGPLPDPAGRLRDALGLPAGGWLLIRPDGHVSGGGAELTESSLTAALAPLHLIPPPSRGVDARVCA